MGPSPSSSPDWEPVAAGVPLGSRTRLGTAGCVLPGARGPLVLTCSHVANEWPDGRVYAVYQRRRGVATGPREGRRIGRAVSHVQLSRTTPNRMEACVVALSPDTDIRLHDAPVVATNVAVGEPLVKVGATTGTTCGVLVKTSWSGPVRFREGRFPFADQWLVLSDDGPLAGDGDSGAVWMTADGRLAAMHLASCLGDRGSICTPMPYVMERLAPILGGFAHG